MLLYPGLKEQIAGYLHYLYKLGLMPWASGNVSIRIRKAEDHADRILIKASGIPYYQVRWGYGPAGYGLVVVLDMDGNHVEDGKQPRPSVDTPIHLSIYRRRPDVMAIVHTHSTYATAFAALGLSIPCLTTIQADIFGGDILCGSAFLDDHDSVAAAIATATASCPAMLLRNHGVFTVGGNIEEAARAAVLVEEVAKVGFLARQAGLAEPLHSETVVRLHKQYQEGYGQKG